MNSFLFFYDAEHSPAQWATKYPGTQSSLKRKKVMQVYKRHLTLVHFSIGSSKAKRLFLSIEMLLPDINFEGIRQLSGISSPLKQALYKRDALKCEGKRKERVFAFYGQLFHQKALDELIELQICLVSLFN